MLAAAGITDPTAPGTLNITGSTVNLTANNGGISADVNASTVVNANSSAANGAIRLQSDSGNLPLGVITAGTGSVSLTGATGISDSNGAGTLNVTGGIVTLVASSGGIATDVNASTAVNADSSAANGAITLQSDSGNLPLGVITSGTGTVSLTGATGIADTNGAGTLNITGGVVTVKAINGSIATDVNASTAVNADTSTTNGSITLQSDSGNLPLGVINAGTGTVSLTGAAGITDSTAPGTLNITGSTVTLVASNGGISADVNASTVVNADSSAANGAIRLQSDSGNLPLGIITSGTGTVSLTAATSVTDTNGTGTLNITGGVVTVKATNGSIATDVNASTAVNADTSATNGPIKIQSDTGNLPLGVINAGTGTVTLTGAAGITDSTAPGTLNITGSTIILVASSGGISADVNASTVVNADSSAANGALRLQSDSGTLPLGIVTAGTGSVTLNSANGITDTNGVGTLNITGGVVTLTASGAITTDVNAVTSVSADSSAANGAITLQSDTGNLPLGLVNAGTGAVTLTGTAALTDSNGAGTPNITGGVVTLKADAGGIATDVNAATLVNADSSAANGAIRLQSDAGNLPQGLINAGAGNVLLVAAAGITDPSGPGTLNVNGSTVSLTANGGGIASNVNASTAVNANSSAGNGAITLQSISGNLPLGVVTAGAGTVSLIGVSGITDTNGAGTLNITGSTVTLKANGAGIATDVNASTAVNADSSATNGNISLQSDSGNLPLGVITAGTGTVTLTATGAITDSTVPGTLNITGSTVNLLAANGGISADVNPSTVVNANSSTANGAIRLQSDSGNLPLGVIAAGTGTVSLTGATGIADTNGAGTLNITGGVVTLVASTGGITTDVNASTAVNANSSAGNGALSLQSDSGNLPLGVITAGTGTVSLTGATGITDTLAASTLNVTGGVVTLDAKNGGITTDVNASTDVNADRSTANGALSLTSAASLPLGTIKAGTGSVTLSTAGTGSQTPTGSITGNQLLLLGTGSFQLTNSANQVTSLAATTNGAINYTNFDALNIAANGSTPGVSSTAGSVAITTLSGNLLVNGPVTTANQPIQLSAAASETLAANVTAGTGLVTLTAAAPSSQTAGAISAASLQLLGTGSYTLMDATNSVSHLAANVGFGISFTNAGALSVDTAGTSTGITTTGPVALTNLAGNLSVNSAVTSNGNPITLNSAGAVNLAANVQATGSTMTLTAATASNQTAGAPSPPARCS